MPKSIGERYTARLALLHDLRKSLEEETSTALADVPHIDRISFRVKMTSAFVLKAEDPRNSSFYSDPLVEIEDQVAGRIIVFFTSDIATVRSRLEATFSPVEHFERRPERDDEFGYESDHLICVIPPQVKPAGWMVRDDLPTTFELQIRTVFMHAYAEPQHDIAYKHAQELPRNIRRELAWIAASAWGADEAYERVRKWTRAGERASDDV